MEFMGWLRGTVNPGIALGWERRRMPRARRRMAVNGQIGRSERVRRLVTAGSDAACEAGRDGRLV
jgi:hypothetical protein